MEGAWINIFDNVEDTICNKKVYAIEVINDIVNGKWKSLIDNYRRETDKQIKEELKIMLPCVTFSGTFKYRSAANIEEYTGIVNIDIDKITRNLKEIKQELRLDPKVAGFFESPSHGIKIQFETNCSAENHKEIAFPVVREYVEKTYNLEVDPSGKDLSRLCFISYDPEAYWNPYNEIIQIDVDKIKREFKSIRSASIDENKFEFTNDSKKIFEKCIEFTRKSSVGHYKKHNRNNFIFALSCHLNRAGMNQELAEQMIVSRYKSLEIKEIRSTVLSAYKHNKSEFGIKPIWQHRSKQIKML